MLKLKFEDKEQDSQPQLSRLKIEGLKKGFAACLGMRSNLFKRTDKVSEASRYVKCEMLKLADGANTAAGSDTVHKRPAWAEMSVLD